MCTGKTARRACCPGGSQSRRPPGELAVAREAIIIDLDHGRLMLRPGREGRRGDHTSGRRTGLTDREDGLGGTGDPAAGETVITRIDRFCDTVPRQRARAEQHGPLVLFVSEGPGWPYYARPKQGARGRITATDVRRVRPVSVSSASPSPS